jgi:hypothetical protein
MTGQCTSIVFGCVVMFAATSWFAWLLWGATECGRADLSMGGEHDARAPRGKHANSVLLHSPLHHLTTEDDPTMLSRRQGQK